MGPLVNDRVDRTDDGTPIQPYQLGEEPSGRARGILGNGAIGVAVAGLVALIRNLVATDSQSASAADQPATSSDAETVRSHDASAFAASSNVVQMVAQTDFNGADSSALDAITLDEQQVLRLLRKPLDQTSLTFDFVASELRHPLPTGAIPSHGNDNESLYGFVPGIGIAFDPSSGLAAVGHGGGGGDGGDGSPPERRSAADEADDTEAGDAEPAPPDNHRPTLANSGIRLRDQFAGHAVVIGLTSLLRGAADPDGDALEVADLQASEGTLRPVGDDRWIYTPVDDASGNVIFTYHITDGSLGTPQFAILNISEPAATQDGGTDGADVLAGTSAADVIDARAGHDTIEGHAGDDVIYGGDGDDLIHGGSGDDIVFAGDGDDVIYGGDGNDIVFAGNGDDTLQGDKGDDTLLGEDGDDTFVATIDDGDDDYVGGDGSDTYTAVGTSSSLAVDLGAGTASSEETGSDTLSGIENVIGSQGDDSLAGDDGANTLSGSAGNDTLTGGAGGDTMSGGQGDDTFVATAGDGDDIIDGGEGSDTLDLSATQAAAAVDLAAGTSESAETGSDTITDIENVTGSQGDDTITGDAAANVIEGGAGGDTMSGGQGDDTFVATAGDGDDNIDGGEGFDTYDASQIETQVVIDLQQGLATGQDIGTDSFAGIENAVGGAGDDILVASDAINMLTGGEGNDLFVFEASPSSSGKGRGYRDQISDFEVGDRIDLKQLSREAGETLEDLGFKRFVLISQGAEFTDPGQMRFRYEMFEDKSYTIIEGNIDDDPDHDFEIELKGRYALEEKDFYKYATGSSGTSHDES